MTLCKKICLMLISSEFTSSILFSSVCKGNTYTPVLQPVGWYQWASMFVHIFFAFIYVPSEGLASFSLT